MKINFGLFVAFFQWRLCFSQVQAFNGFGFFKPTDTFDVAPEFANVPGAQMFMIGGWFKWNGCTKQHIASDDSDDRGRPDYPSNGDWLLWHAATLIDEGTDKHRLHDCSKWVAAAWIFSVDNTPKLSDKHENIYMMPYKSDSDRDPTSKEIIYTVGSI